MVDTSLYISLGDTRYLVECPWGEFGSGPYTVTDVACDTRGHVLVLVRRIPFRGQVGCAVIELDPTGKKVGEWADEVVDAHRLTIAPDGQVLIVDRDSHAVVIFDGQGNKLAEHGRRGFGGQPFTNPTDVAVTSNGDMFVADGYGGAKVHRLSADGDYLGSFGFLGAGDGELITPHALVILPADASEPERVVVADRDNNRVCLFTTEGVYLRSWTNFYLPMALSHSHEGGIIVSDQIPRFSLFTAQGELRGMTRAVPTLTHGIHMGPDGTYFLIHMSMNAVTRLVPVGPAS